MFIKIGDIKGESQDSTHKDQIDVLAWSWGMSNSGTTHTGGGAGEGKASVQDFTFTKFVDLSTTDLMLGTLTGQHFDEATFVVQKAGGVKFEFLKITFKEVIITSVSTGGSGGEDRLTENVSLNFAEVEVEYTPQKADGTAGPSKKFSYNIAENTA
ncbi:MAG: Hcp family type VI secretion system effector [Nitrososphaerales archaeon]